MTAQKLHHVLGRYLALSTEQINQLAESTADALSSNDPEKVQEATENLAVGLGNEMVKFAKTAELRQHLETVMGHAGTVKEVSQLLGAAGTASGKRALAEYVGQALINATPAAGVVGFYKSAYGVMKYAKDQFASNQIEELYQTYKRSGEETAKQQMDLAGFGWMIRERRKPCDGGRGVSGCDRIDSDWAAKGLFARPILFRSGRRAIHGFPMRPVSL